MLRLVRDRWLSIVVLTLLTTTVATVLVLRATPVYSSQATLYVSSRADSSNLAVAYQGSLLSQQQVSSFARLIGSEPVLSQAAQDLGPDVTATELAARVSASVVPDTSLLMISATDLTPLGAQNTANAVALRFVAILPSLQGSTPDEPPPVVVTVVNPAGLSTVPISPKPVRSIGIGAVLGLLAGLAAAAARQALDQTVKSVDQAQELVHAPGLGSVPADPGAPRRPLATGADAQRARAEALRKIGASLRFLDVERRHGVLLITSPVAREGKSTTACNLALTLARTGRRVILIDGDLRRPQVGGYLGLPSGVGLTSVLVGVATIEEATQTWADHQFSVLASGPIPPNPSEMLGSQRMRDLLALLRTRYDDVLVDAPPVLPVADAAIAAAGCDGVILIARYGRTRRDKLQQAAATIRASQTPILGVILNRTPRTSGPDNYYYATEPSTAGDDAAPSRDRRRPTALAEAPGR